MRRFSLIELQRLDVVTLQQELSARKALFFGDQTLESILRGARTLPSRDMTNFVVEWFRWNILKGEIAISRENLADCFRVGAETGLDAVEDKTALRPNIDFKVLEHLGDALVAPSLLTFAIAELVKNCADSEASFSLASKTANSIIVQLKNPGQLGPNLDWFRTSAQPSLGYAYGGAHGAAQKGLGVGVQMAKCSLAAFGASVHVNQVQENVVATIVISDRHGTLKVV